MKYDSSLTGRSAKRDEKVGIGRWQATRKEITTPLIWVFWGGIEM